MSEPLRPGPPGTPVPNGVTVVRFGRTDRLNDEALRQLREEHRPHPTMFTLSSRDEAGPVPHLSVWVEQVTPVAVAWRLIGARPDVRAVVRLTADGVRSVPIPAGCPALDVAWFPALVVGADGQPTPDLRAGAEGHAGITNLEKPSKAARRDIRDELCARARAEYLNDQDVAAYLAQASG